MNLPREALGQAVVCSSAVKSRLCVSVSNAVHVDFLNSLIKGSHRYPPCDSWAQHGDRASGTCCGDIRESDTESLQLLTVLGDGSWHGILGDLPTTLKPLCKTRAGETQGAEEALRGGKEASQGAEEASQGSSPNQGPAGHWGDPGAGVGGWQVSVPRGPMVPALRDRAPSDAPSPSPLPTSHSTATAQDRPGGNSKVPWGPCSNTGGCVC